MREVFVGWKDGQRGTDRKLTVSLSAFGKKEDQQLPDEPNPDNEKEKENLREAVGLNTQLQIQTMQQTNIVFAD